jgi:hypothetical protein
LYGLVKCIATSGRSLWVGKMHHVCKYTLQSGLRAEYSYRTSGASDSHFIDTGPVGAIVRQWNGRLLTSFSPIGLVSVAKRIHKRLSFKPGAQNDSSHYPCLSGARSNVYTQEQKSPYAYEGRTLYPTIKALPGSVGSSFGCFILQNLVLVEQWYSCTFDVSSCSPGP